MRKLSTEELARESVIEFQNSEKQPIVLLLDNIRSLHNVGTFFRTGDAFNIEKILLCGITGTPPHREIQKTALGATESVSWQYFEDALVPIKEYKERGYKIVGIEQTDESIWLPDWDFDHELKMVLIFGNEISGVQQKILDVCDGSLEIPQFGTKHSFNVSVVAGIVLYDITTKKMYRKNSQNLKKLSF